LGNQYQVLHTLKPTAGFSYAAEERSVSIFSKYPAVRQLETFRHDTSICNVLQTPFGELAVYGTIIGNPGNRESSFNVDLDNQLNDCKRIAALNNLCIAGNFNISVCDNYYFTRIGRDKLNTSFKKLNLENYTEIIPNNIDHIILPKAFVIEKKEVPEYWNEDKKLSDHLGVSIRIN